MLHHDVERLHELGDRAGEVPPVHVEEVDVAGLKLFETGFEREVQGLGAVATGIDDDLFVAVAGAVASGKFCGDDHLVAIIAFFHPFADPLL